MKFPCLFVCVFLFSSTTLVAQNKQFLYGFQEIPQSLLENPGGEVTFNKHIGIPFLSGIYTKLGTSNELVSNLFANSSIDFNDKFKNIIFRLKPRDFIAVNQKLDLINIGFKLKNDKDYLSFGLYQELDLISYYPKDVSVLYYQGNKDGNGNLDLNKAHDLSEIRLKGEIVGVLHAGISRKFNEKLTVGVRAKVYSGGFNIQSLHNKGTLSTSLDQNNNAQHFLNGIDFTFNSSGLVGTTNETFVKDVLKNAAFGGNLGLGFDAGFTYHLKDNITITGSVLDVGFISYSKNVTTYKIKGDIIINGIDLFDPPANQTSDYWDTIGIDFRSRGVIDTLHNTYVSFRSPKVNTAVYYKFGRQTSSFKQTSCTTGKRSDRSSLHEVGVQLYTIFRPKQPQFSTTLFYSRTFSKLLKAKITYTADDYSFTNLGLGFSAQLGKFNLYAAADNVISYNDIYTSKKIGFLFGMNLIFE